MRDRRALPCEASAGPTHCSPTPCSALHRPSSSALTGGGDTLVRRASRSGCADRLLTETAGTRQLAAYQHASDRSAAGMETSWWQAFLAEVRPGAHPYQLSPAHRHANQHLRRSCRPQDIRLGAAAGWLASRVARGPKADDESARTATTTPRPVGAPRRPGREPSTGSFRPISVSTGASLPPTIDAAVEPANRSPPRRWRMTALS